MKVTRSNKAESLLLLRLAQFVVIGNPDGHAHTARDRARTPCRALSDTTLRLRVVVGVIVWLGDAVSVWTDPLTTALTDD